MSSTDPTTIGVHRALHEALNSARQARQRLDDGEAAPDLDDLVELGTLLASLSESLMAINAGMTAKARLARGSANTGTPVHPVKTRGRRQPRVFGAPRLAPLVLVNDHAADVLAVVQVLVGLVHLVERVLARDELIQLELP